MLVVIVAVVSARVVVTVRVVLVVGVRAAHKLLLCGQPVSMWQELSMWVRPCSSSLPAIGEHGGGELGAP